MDLEILVPSRVFAQKVNISRIVAETTAGSIGILPKRLDFAAALVPGILMYETEKECVEYVAVGEGILIKAGARVLVSVRMAAGNAKLGALRGLVEKEMKLQDEKEMDIRSVMVKLESGFIRSIQQLTKG
jgi:F-type H+-transporting ATPase subunit epsilon